MPADFDKGAYPEPPRQTPVVDKQTALPNPAVILSKLFYYSVDLPVTTFRDAVDSIRSSNKAVYYHQKFRRVPDLADCQHGDYLCYYEAEMQWRRDYKVDQEIVKVVQERMRACQQREGPSVMMNTDVATVSRLAARARQTVLLQHQCWIVLKLPYFMNELTLADLDMGTCLPQVLSTSKPKLDHRGLWLEMELMYTGCLQMTLVTKMNLCKLGREGEDEAHAVPQMHPVGSKPRMCVLADSDEESSSAGSSDEEEVPQFEPQGTVGEKNTIVAADGHTGGSTGRKFLRFVDKIAKSKYFQKATENEYIRKKIAEMSNMPLLLSVEVLELSGTLAINIPPPPTDRIWYSFQGPPRLDLHVRPMLGEREVTLTHVTEWIEKKLQCEFQKVFVMPNMDDLYLPLMTSGLESSPASHHSSVQSTSQQSSMESQEYMSE